MLERGSFCGAVVSASGGESASFIGRCINAASDSIVFMLRASWRVDISHSCPSPGARSVTSVDRNAGSLLIPAPMQHQAFLRAFRGMIGVSGNAFERRNVSWRCF
ncbi:hypothetical protein DQ04_07491030 [Trypanosoma grayi]|uniref:hypothetical protein n=1 Tax=Trypanosoma grayi TaxID=71804 RepID=UPI0004F3F557|nr:hypothetical protein DQ04_07491030 [Trypanosoma grayi]KEG08302.1 hypothetical protein DQ04_07491030 [Trypanosoma grayi]